MSGSQLSDTGQCAEGPEWVRCGLGQARAGEAALGRARWAHAGSWGRSQQELPPRHRQVREGDAPCLVCPAGPTRPLARAERCGSRGLWACAGGTRLRSQLRWAARPRVCRSEGRPRVGGRGGPEGSVPEPHVPRPCPGGFVIGGQGRPVAAGGQLGVRQGRGRGCPAPGTLWRFNGRLTGSPARDVEVHGSRCCLLDVS